MGGDLDFVACLHGGIDREYVVRLEGDSSRFAGDWLIDGETVFGRTKGNVPRCTEHIGVDRHRPIRGDRDRTLVTQRCVDFIRGTIIALVVVEVAFGQAVNIKRNSSLSSPMR